MALPTTPTFPLTAGFHPSGTSYELTWGDYGRFDWSKIDYSHELPGEDVYGHGVARIGEAPGRYKATFSVEMPMLEGERLLAAIGSAYMTKHNLVQWTGKEGDAFDHKYAAEAVRITKEPTTIEGGKATMMKLECSCNVILRDGIAPFVRTT